MTRLEQLCEAIKSYEGWYWGSRSWRNNNPGNLRFSIFQSGQKDGFAVFPSSKAGYWALWWDLFQKCRGYTVTGLNRDKTLENLINVWAPPSENDTLIYVGAVSKQLNIPPSTKLSYFLKDIDEPAPQIDLTKKQEVVDLAEQLLKKIKEI